MLFGAFHPKAEDERSVFAFVSVLILLLLSNIGFFFGVAYEKSFLDMEEHFPVGNFFAGAFAVIVCCYLISIAQSGLVGRKVDVQLTPALKKAYDRMPLRYVAAEVGGAFLFFAGTYGFLLSLYSRYAGSVSPLMSIILLAIAIAGFGIYNRFRSEIMFPLPKAA